MQLHLRRTTDYVLVTCPGVTTTLRITLGIPGTLNVNTAAFGHSSDETETL